MNFFGYELQLMWWDIYRFIRALAAATLKGKFRHYPAVATELFNLVSSRLAIPWLLWRVHIGRPEERVNQIQV